MPTTITVGNHTPGDITANAQRQAQDVVANAQRQYEQQARDAMAAAQRQIQDSQARLRGDTTNYDTSGVGGTWPTTPAQGKTVKPGAATGQTQPTFDDIIAAYKAGNGNDYGTGAGTGYQYIPTDPYVNPFGNDAQVKALNDYAKQLEREITSQANALDKYLRDNAVALVANGQFGDAVSAARARIGDMVSAYKDIISQGAYDVIHNPGGTSGFTLPDWYSGTGDIPGITPGTLPEGTTGEVPDLQPSDTSTPPAPYSLPDIPGPNPERVEHVDTEALKQILQQIVDSQRQQTESRTDYTVQQGINELTRAMEDAAKAYQTQRNQVSADEARALDNQALYSEARGDRGGIGEAQYAAIQNAAATNRRAVNDAQVKLGTDTARQIADLRAQGEFEKADQLLSLTQSRLAQLMELEQWALGTNLGVDEFNSQLQQWVDEYNLDKQKFLSDLELSAAGLTGVFSDGTRTFEAQQALISSLANSGTLLLNAGVMPSQQQLQAMGITAAQAREYITKKTSGLGILGLI